MILVSNTLITFYPTDRGILKLSANESQNVFTSSLEGQLVVTVRPDAPRAGTLPLFFDTAADAETARAALATQVGLPWILQDDIEQLNMAFVRRGALALVQQDSRKRWVLELGFQEVSLI